DGSVISNAPLLSLPLAACTRIGVASGMPQAVASPLGPVEASMADTSRAIDFFWMTKSTHLITSFASGLGIELSAPRTKPRKGLVESLKASPPNNESAIVRADGIARRMDIGGPARTSRRNVGGTRPSESSSA